MDDRELAALQIVHPEITAKDSTWVALAARLDYLNSKDGLEDADRKVKVAANFLKPRLAFTSSVTFSRLDSKNTGVPLPDFNRYSAGLDLDPAFDRTAERNASRRELISRHENHHHPLVAAPGVHDFGVGERGVRHLSRASCRTNGPG